MPIYIYILLAWVIGSFCGAYAYRWPRSMSMLKPRFSHCPSCKAPIPFYHNIPLISFVLLRGKSACCKKSIAWDYFIIELTSVVLYPIVIYPFLQASFLIQLQWTVFFYFLLVQTFIDLRHRLIPDEISLGGTILGLAFSFAYGPDSWQYLKWRLLGAIVGFGSLWLIAKLYKLYSGQEGLGMGDMKLMMMIGSFLAIFGVFQVIFVSSIIGLVVGIVVMIKEKSTLKTAIPFGPCIAVAALGLYLWSLYGALI